MFQYPGTRPGENLKDDVQQLRQWLAVFLPELEQQLANLGTDNFTTAYNERIEGVTGLTGAAKQSTTAAAVAEHLLDRNNPHNVTLRQLGYQGPQVTESEDGTRLITFGGLTMQVRDVPFEATAAEGSSRVYRQEISLGDWAVPFTEILAEGTQLAGMTDGWLGAVSGGDLEHCGTAVLYTPTNSAGEGSIQIWAIGRAEDHG